METFNLASCSSLGIEPTEFVTKIAAVAGWLLAAAQSRFCAMVCDVWQLKQEEEWGPERRGYVGDTSLTQEKP